MRAHIEELIHQAVGYLKRDDKLPRDIEPAFQVDQPRDPEHGDYACNVALVLAKAARRKPREIAEMIVAKLPASKRVRQVDIAGPGFLNFFASDHHLRSVVREVLSAGNRYGHLQPGEKEDVLAEYVSANPTGPLHVAGCLNLITVGFYPSHRSATPLRWQTCNDADRRRGHAAAR